MSLPPELEVYWPLIVDAARFQAVNPYDIAALMWRETRAGTAPRLDRPGPKGRGDGGHGCGLMQLDNRSHPDLIAALDADGSPRWQDPEFNIRAGTQIYAHALFRFTSYPGLVPETARLAAIASYNAGEGATRHALLTLAHATHPWAFGLVLRAVDPITTHGDYVSDVTKHAAIFAQPPQEPTA